MRPTETVLSSLVTATNLLEIALYGATTRVGTGVKVQIVGVTPSGVSRHCADGLESD